MSEISRSCAETIPVHDLTVISEVKYSSKQKPNFPFLYSWLEQYYRVGVEIFIDRHLKSKRLGVWRCHWVVFYLSPLIFDKVKKLEQCLMS